MGHRAGIAAAEQTRIFEEFYQTPSTATPTAEQRRGLGLGLAIVRRLSTPIGSDVQLRSVPGRGSVFGVASGRPAPPLALSARAGDARARADAGWPDDLIVEDDAAVRAGPRGAAAGMGAQVRSLDSMAEVLRAVDNDADSPPPDPLIVDYRPGRGTPA